MQIAKADLMHIKMYIEQDSVYYANKTIQEITAKERNVMATTWTTNQLQAINKRDKNILVAAAARKR